jgi:hypothetical protein
MRLSWSVLPRSGEIDAIFTLRTWLPASVLLGSSQRMPALCSAGRRLSRCAVARDTNRTPWCWAVRSAIGFAHPALAPALLSADDRSLAHRIIKVTVGVRVSMSAYSATWNTSTLSSQDYRAADCFEVFGCCAVTSPWSAPLTSLFSRTLQDGSVSPPRRLPQTRTASVTMLLASYCRRKRAGCRGPPTIQTVGDARRLSA